MSRPRKPYGPKPPGRLYGTMIKVLAAELSDQGRLSRGKQYWAEDAVVDIVVGHGAVTAEIQGNRSQPYIVTLEAAAGSGVPSKLDLWVQCTCPDDTGTGADACKHAVAALFALSDEVTIEPELVERWRDSRREPRAREAAVVTRLPNSQRFHPPGADRDIDDDLNDDNRNDDDGEDDGGSTAQIIELHPRIESELDKISVLLQSPAGAAPPSFPDPVPIDHRGIRDRVLNDVLNDALDELGIRWE
jgi:hypothetical protein